MNVIGTTCHYKTDTITVHTENGDIELTLEQVKNLQGYLEGAVESFE